MTKGEFIEQLSNMPTRDEILAVERATDLVDITSRIKWNVMNHSIANHEILLELIDIPMEDWCNILSFIVINMDLQATAKIEVYKINLRDFLENDAFYVSEYLREVFKDTLENQCFQIIEMSFQDLKKVVAAGIL